MTGLQARGTCDSKCRLLKPGLGQNLRVGLPEFLDRGPSLRALSSKLLGVSPEYGCFQKLGIVLVGVLTIRALRFARLYLGPDCWERPCNGWTEVLVRL